ncbi:MAG: condensation domain-containing protein, partial [Clostridiales bacterium]|nr:condensation domain-containing protein [Clostridiales bacterium]
MEGMAGNSYSENHNIEEIRELTPLQLNILRHCLTEHEPGQYFWRQVLETSGDVDETAFKTALDRLAYRHDVLRSIFIIPKHSGKPRQVVLKRREITLISLDFSGAPLDAYAQAIDEDNGKGFALEKDSLLRVTLIKRGDRTSILWSVHHIIADEWSLRRITSDFSRYYTRLTAGETPENLTRDIDAEKENAASFGQFIQWLNRRDGEAAQAYWRQILDGYGGALGAPAEITPMGLVNQEPSARADTIDFTLNAAENEILFQRAEELGVFPRDVMEAAWGLVLCQYNGVSDVVFGEAVSGRDIDLLRADQTAGLFCNIIPVRFTYAPGETAREALLARSQQRQDRAAHEFLSLQEIFNITRLGENLFRTAIVFEDEAEAPEEHGLFDALSITDFRGQINCPICLKTYEQKNGLAFSVLYDPRLYAWEEAKLIGSRTLMAIKGLCGDLFFPVDKMKLDGQEEPLYSLLRFNDAGARPGAGWTITERLEFHAGARPGAVFAEFGDIAITYGELNAKANQIARKLRSMGAQPDSFVALFMERGLEMLIAAAAVLKAGAAFVPIDADASRECVRYILDDCEPVAVLLAGAPQGFGTVASAIAEMVPTLDLIAEQDSFTWEDVTNPPRVSQPSDLAYCLY